MKRTSVQVGEGSTSTPAPPQELSFRTFTHWICYLPKEKWTLLYDIGGSRYGVMTTDLTEPYNML
jgi:hypothetical protein